MRQYWTCILVVGAAAQAASSGVPTPIDALGQCYGRQAALVPFSGVVLARGTAGEFVRTAGFVDTSQTTAITQDTRFRIASVQKVVTKTAIGLLVDQGRLKFDDPVGKYVTGLPPELASVTIEQLVDHRSGAVAFTRLTPETETMLRGAKSTSDLVALVASQPMSFRPGERQEYSNGGYFLLGAVIERVSGMSYGAYLKEAIFDPLGMTATSLEADSHTAAPLSKMAMEIGPVERRATSAGDGVSTAADLAKLGAALTGDTFLSKATRERLFPRRGESWRIGQGGGTMGTNTDLAAFPENGWVVVVLSNYDPPAGTLMAEALRGVVLGNGCKPLTETDRPSPFRMIRRPAS